MMRVLLIALVLVSFKAAADEGCFDGTPPESHEYYCEGDDCTGLRTGYAEIDLAMLPQPIIRPDTVEPKAEKVQRWFFPWSRVASR